MNAPAELALEIGHPYGGGILLGRFFAGAVPFALIKAPKAEGSIEMPWGKSKKSVDGALSVYDGLANTRAMAEAGSELAQWATGLRIGGHDDWYVMSRGEGLLAFAANLDGDEAFERDWHWTSTQYAGNPEYAWGQFFGNGYQDTWRKSYKLHAVAVRRAPIR